ncbi:MAG: Rha family transcriptional regulator [Lachnospiraceae bacterium]|jgi:Uncharacterized phage-encoded protein
MQNQIEQTLNSREVSEMIEKKHKDLIRDIKRYIKQMNEVNEKYSIERKIAPNEFFQNSEYKDSIGRTLPCYNITKKGCEFIAHKLTGTKGTVFTARYINRFHEMEDIISNKEKEPELPWFIHKFEGKYIMLFRDFEAITGVHLSGNYTSLKRTYHLTGGSDWNGWRWYTSIDKEEFKQEYGFDYGNDQCMYYLYPCGIAKALDILMNDKTVHIKEETYRMLVESVKSLALHKEVKTVAHPPANILADGTAKKLPVSINITISNGQEDYRQNILL